MRFHHSLDTILSRSTNVRVLRFFCRKGGAWNGRRIAGELGMNPVTTHKTLRDLHQATLLDFRKVGNNFVYSLRDEHYLIRELLRPLFHREAQAYAHLLARLKQSLSVRSRSQVISAAIYGSLVTHRERPTSDVDVVLIVASEATKQEIRQAVDRLWEPLIKEFGNPVALYIATVRDARHKVQRNLPLFQNILQHHQLLFGKPLEEVLRVR